MTETGWRGVPELLGEAEGKLAIGSASYNASLYTEPANIPHFVEVREPVMIQVSGTGPSGRRFVNPADNPK